MGISGLIYVDIRTYKIKLGRSNVTGHIYCPISDVHFPPGLIETTTTTSNNNEEEKNICSGKSTEIHSQLLASRNDATQS